MLLFACQKDDYPVPASPLDPPPFEQTFPIVYQAVVPDGKLPWPQHDPTISQTSYSALLTDLSIINNFGQYQCGDGIGSCYFHDGLDIVLENGTPIFAVEPGVVQANIGGDQYYRSLVVEGLDEPGMGWAYTHIYHFQVAEGATVVQGQFLGRVNFKGLDHIHFSRVRLDDGGSWRNFSDLLNLFPDDFFIFHDDSPPIVLAPFLFYKNRKEERFEHGAVDTVSGQADIVVGMRDPGAYANDFIGTENWGDRLAVRRIEYSSRKDGVTLLDRPSFDFARMEFRFSQNKWLEALTVFKHHLTVDPDHENFNRFVSHYILTNARDSLSGEINPADGHLAWNTLETNGLDEPVFENGLYEIEVRAWDSHGNFASQLDSVFVKNQ